MPLPETRKTDAVAEFAGLYWAWVEQDRAEGRKLRDDLIALYNHRGKMVHEGSFEVTREQVSLLYSGTQMGFLLFTDLLMNSNLKTSDELREWYLQHRPQLEE